MTIPTTQKVVLIDGVSDGYDVIKYQDFETPQITGPKDLIIKNKYAGVNFIESYFRKGIYPITAPYLLGREASGVVAAIGSDVTDYKVGDKVFYSSNKTFAQYTKISADDIILSKVPDDASEEDLRLFGSFVIQTITAYTFAEEPYVPKPTDYALVWAAAGGVGVVLTQILANRGVQVIGLASTDEKLQLVKSLGAKYTINYKTEDVAAKVAEITNGKGVKVSYDSVGQASWDTSVASLGTGGYLVSYGNSSGPISPVNLYKLPRNIAVLRPTCSKYIQDKETWEYYSGKILGDYKSGAVKIPPPQEFPLEEYKEVTKVLESGKTTGKSVLKIPQ